MKLIFLFLFIPAICFGQSVLRIVPEKDRVNITFPGHNLSIIPLNDNAVRIQFTNQKPVEIPELILIENIQTPFFEINETEKNLEIILKSFNLIFDRKTGAISYSDKNGNVFLSEKTGSRMFVPDSVSGEACYIASQTFNSPEDEAIFGLGSFQDRQFNLRGVSRKLLQVNTQISIPFIYSNQGYGLLWHQYGLTEFNPAINEVTLVKEQDSISNDYQIEIPTVSGSQKVLRQQAHHRGSFRVDKDGIYSIVLDLGDMDKIHFLSIDGEPAIEQNNYWLPPVVSKQVYLNAGTHYVDIVCKWSSSPKVKWRAFEKYTTFSSPNAKMLDYVVFYGPKADDVISNYRKLSGNVPMLPLWAYGFWQSREKYSTSKQLIATVQEFRKRKIPMDVIVQDWQYWGKYGWGVPRFDGVRYPNPKKFIGELHKLNSRLTVSVWENIDRFSEIGKSYADSNYFIKNSKWLDMFNPGARETYWKVLNKNMFSFGVDGWWMDANEPENDSLKGKSTFAGPGDFYRLSYPLFASRAVYEGQRNQSSDKRVCILSRSAFAGQQVYGTISWSGQVGSSWDAFSRQIAAGLNHSMTGMPYWTSDIGGFYRPGLPQFNPGKPQYTDVKYHELLVRWFQFGCFSPVMRVHGYQSETEPWKYGKNVERMLLKMLQLRYRLIPYIYSQAWQISANGYTLMRPLVMDFKDDATAVNHKYQYMFGQSFLVAPIVRPDIETWDVYLPGDKPWYNFWTGKKYEGGKTIETKATLDIIPLYVKAGSIVPMGKFIQYTAEKLSDTLEIRVYPGDDGSFLLYEDEGDNYNYEKGEYSTIRFDWNEQEKVLTVNEIQGSYSGMLKKRVFNISWMDDPTVNGINQGTINKQVIYEGEKLILKQ